jgi:hypothetical protein
MSTLISGTAMASKKLGTSTFEHFRIFDSFGYGWENAELGSDWDRETVMKGVYCQWDMRS